MELRVKAHHFPGTIGKDTLAEFYPLLQMGEYLHIGKACTFGLGKYESGLL